MDNWSDLPEHVATYLFQRVVSLIPEGVLETLVTLSPEELDALERVGASLDAAGADFTVTKATIH
jgi:hypothetical protein